MIKENSTVCDFSSLDMQTSLFEELESEVRSYCRSFPTIFKSSLGAILEDQQGNKYIDFLAGAGALNYGHNNPVIKKEVISYLEENGIVHALDMYTSAKHDFISALQDIILSPRNMDYKVTFPGPTGTNAVETALKFARVATGRHNVVAFTNAFHGMTQGSLALSGNASKRTGIGVPLSGVFRVPFDGYAGNDFDTAALLEKMLEDSGSGLDAPAAIILETVQAEGGLECASKHWLQKIAKIAKHHGALLIVDDIQAGCGRTGSFFSFENMGIQPDIICLSKSIGGMGLPMSLVLLRPDLDVLKPGQHNGTFRGHNLAFVAAKAALEFWKNSEFEKSIYKKSEIAISRLEQIIRNYHVHNPQVKGRGMMLGISWSDTTIAGKVSSVAFRNNLVIETSGADDQVLKLLPPLTIDEVTLNKGLDIVEHSLAEVLNLPIIEPQYIAHA